jgi:site-specific recombinase XerD
MRDLFLVRNHSSKCPHAHKGPRFLNCKCNLGVDGEMKGERYRRSLFTRNLDKAYRKLANLERPDFREPKLLEEAISAFKASKEDIGHGTKRNHRRALDNFLAIAKAANIAWLDDVEIETIDLFRAKRPISAMTWTKELAILRNFFGFCVSRKWCQSNPAKEVKSPKVKPKAKEPYSEEEVTQILEACTKLGRGPYERDRAEAMILLLRYTGLRISDVATLSRDRVKGDHIYLHTMKNGKSLYLPIPPLLRTTLDGLPDPKGTIGKSRHFFWSGNGTTRAVIRGATRTLGRVFELSGVGGAHAHRFRHTIATALLEKGWTTEDVADVLGSTPEIIRKHYAQWTVQRQERILSLAQDVWSGKFLASSKKMSVTVDSTADNLVDGMGLEPTTPTLRTWCSPS